MSSAPLPTDVRLLQQMLLHERQQKERVLGQLDVLEKEIHLLKSIITSPPANTFEEPSSSIPPLEFKGQVILVVDDQAINLDLVESLLEDENLKIVCKSSALEALEFMRHTHPELILMDIQMPDMDGYAATKKIRSEFSQYNPIILAMTANDTEEDRQKSLAAGMQGHIGKPIDAHYLLTQLSYWLNNRAICDIHSSAPAQLDASEESTENTLLIEELPGIDLPEALARLRGNRILLEEVLISFADKAALIVPELEQAKRENNIDAATRSLHRLKGTSANLSAYKIAPLAAKLESQCKNGKMPDEEELFALEIAINELIITAQGLQPAMSLRSNNDGVDQQQLEQCLIRISTHLHSDLGEAEEAVEALNRLCQHTPLGDSANQLRTFFYQFNLRAVTDLISKGFEQG